MTKPKSAREEVKAQDERIIEGITLEKVEEPKPDTRREDFYRRMAGHGG